MARRLSPLRRVPRPSHEVRRPDRDDDLGRDPSSPDTAQEVSIAEAPDRLRVRLTGQLRTVTLRPRGGVPALEAELHDGTAGVVLVWLGRRRIAGVAPGRSLVVEGRIGRSEKRRVLYNPRYELLP